VTDYLLRFPRPLRRAFFVRRPHRFSTVCRMEDGTEVESHMADPGRLREVLVDGAELYLDGPFGAPRKLAWSTVLARRGDAYLTLQSQMPNRLFPLLLAGGFFPTLGDGVVRSEVKHADSRYDFQVGPTLVEVKGLTLHRGDGLGAFPDAPSARARKHVRGLEAHVRAGGRAAVVFVGGLGDIERVTVARDIDPEFADAMASAAEAGVQVLAAGVIWDQVGASGAYAIEWVPEA
jgi:sugar fermentation stimulation protein A